MQSILIITTPDAWNEAQRSGEYRSDTLQTEGFIHGSTPEQVVAVAERRYAGRRDLILLVIDPARVQPEIRYEMAKNGERYPHIYGPLNVDAARNVVPFPSQPDGTFRLPDLGIGS